MRAETVKIGRHGTIVIPMALRKHFGLNEGDMLIAEDHGEGIMVRPAITLPVETYTQERQAEFLLSNAINQKDYQKARKIVAKMGLDPDKIQHYRAFEG